MASANNAMPLNSVSGTPPGPRRMTSSNGASLVARSWVGTTADATTVTPRYATAATPMAPNSARGNAREGSRTSSAMFTESSKPINV